MQILKKIRTPLLVCVALITVAVILICVSVAPLAPAVAADLPEGRHTAMTEAAFEEDPLAPAGMLRVAADDGLTLYLDPGTGAFSVYNADDGTYWNSNPGEEWLAGVQTSGTARSRMRSQFLLTYYDADGLKQTFNTYEHCVSAGELTVKAIPDGAAVTYRIGENKIELGMLPAGIEEERFEEKIRSRLSGKEREDVVKYYLLRRISDMTEEQQKQYRELFPDADPDRAYYFLDRYTPDYAIDRLYAAIFRSADYTFSDMEADNAALGYAGETDALLQIELTVEYTLRDGALTVRIPAADLSVPDHIYLTDLDFLPFFGTAGPDDSGYTVVPDGAGGLIDLNNGRTQTPMLEIPVYGTDGSLSVTEQNVSYADALLPIYAMVKNNAAYLAVIEGGDACATVCALVSGMDTDLNQVYPSFNLLPMDQMLIKTSKDTMSTNQYADAYYRGDLTVRFSFYGEDGADYTALANAYRSYLIKKGTLTERVGEHALQISLTGAVKVQKNLFGIPYNARETVTTFRQAAELVQMLQEAGVERLHINYRSWFGGGLATDLPYRVSPDGALGGKKDLAGLAKQLGAAGRLSLGASMQTVWKGLPTFNIFRYANRYLTNRTAVGYQYNIATNLADEKAASYYTADARYLGSLTENFTDRVIGLGDYGVWFDDLAAGLSSNFKNGNQLDRTAAKLLITDALKGAGEQAYITLSRPNAYAFSYADVMLELPVTSSQSYLINRDIPFLQIVLAGCAQYTTPALNEMGNLNGRFLKTVETGSDLYFDWIFADDEEVAVWNGREPRSLFSKNYKNSMAQAIDYYLRLTKELYPIAQGAVMQHEMLGENLFRTTWEKGSVIVNYGTEDVMFEGKTVPGGDFIVTEVGH